MATRGMVTSPHSLATTAGLQVLQEGGNAVEAAICSAAVIAVVYPHMNGVGGDNFWLLYDANQAAVRSLMATGQAGRKATPQTYKDAGYPSSLPVRGVLAANTVPGSVDGWLQAYEYSRQFLNGKIPLQRLLEPAIYYAESGFPVTPSQEDWTSKNIGIASGVFGHLELVPGFAKTFLKPTGLPYRAGERFFQPNLGATLRAIAKGGREAFYEGAIAKTIAQFLREQDGLLSEEDFAAYHSRWEDPLSIRYRDWSVYNTPPPTQGLTSLQILKILEQHPIREWGEDSSLYYHVMVEATKQAFKDRDKWVSDPDFTQIPIQDLLSSRRIQELNSNIDLVTATMARQDRAIGGDTVWLGVVDEQGHAVSLIQSIYFDFGSGVIAGDTGILLQNRGSSFVLDETHPNFLTPGKRPFHTLNPAMALRDNQPELVYGTMGGEGQPQTQAAIFTRILELGMDVQAAIDAPRWLYGRTWGEETSLLSIEARTPAHIVEDLRGKGHELRIVGAWDEKMGHAQAIWIDPVTKTRYAGADTRGDGIAAGY